MSNTSKVPVKLCDVEPGDGLVFYWSDGAFENSYLVSLDKIRGLYIFRWGMKAWLADIADEDGFLHGRPKLVKAVSEPVKPQRTPSTDRGFEEVSLEDINPEDTILSVWQGSLGRHFLVFRSRRDGTGVYYLDRSLNKVNLKNVSPYVNARYYRLNTEVSESNIPHQSQDQAPSTSPQDPDECECCCEEIPLSEIKPGQVLQRICGETEPFPEFTIYDHDHGLFFVDTDESIVFLEDLTDDDESTFVLKGFKRMPTSQTAENDVGQSWWLKKPGVLAYGTSKFEIIVTNTKGFAANWGDIRLQTIWSIELEDLKRLCEARYIAFCELGIEP